MAASDGSEHVRASLLDRLLDDDPERTRDVPKAHGQLLTELRRAVIRDVSNLLNNRQRCVKPPSELKDLRPSVIDYGIPDFTGANVSGGAPREQLRVLIEESLRLYEPRFKRVRVELLENSDPIDRTLRFRVDALLHADPAPEPITFDSIVRPAIGAFQVEGRASE